MISIALNGKPHTLETAVDIATLLATLGVNPQQVAVAVNGEVVTRNDWPRAPLRDGDVVEVVRAVGGG